MKLLMFNTNEFWYRTFEKTVDNATSEDREERIKDALLIYLHVEEEDEGEPEKKVRKAADNVLWLAKKTGRNRIILHSFAHLSDSRSSVEGAEKIILKLHDRLREKGYDVSTTPFGYLLEFSLHVRGESLARVWKSL